MSQALTQYDAHPFEPGEKNAERCEFCGGNRMSIRHHPTRIRATFELHGLPLPESLQKKRKPAKRAGEPTRG